MGDTQLSEALWHRGIYDPRVLAAIASLRRADFLPETLAPQAQLDEPLPIGFGQTISQPFIVAYMTQALHLQPGHRVLELGTGSGYQAAVLSRMGCEVYSMEIVPPLAHESRGRLQRLQIAVHLREGDGSLGWPDAAPFDAILLAAAPEEVPAALFDQLRPGGRLVAPLGKADGPQRLVRFTRRLHGPGVESERLLEVRFVPLTSSPPFA